jgi:hypothetical protein
MFGRGRGGSSDGPESLVEEALRLAASFEQSHPDWHDEVAWRAAAFFAQQGDRQRATSVALRAGARQETALWRVASALADSGDGVAAVGALLANPDLPNVGFNLSKLAAQCAARGDLAGARSAIERIGDPGWRDQALCALARGVSQAGRHAEAEPIARQITAKGFRADALSHIVIDMWVAGERRGAESLLAALDVGARQAALSALGTKLAHLGRLDEAFAVAARTELGEVSRSALLK